MAASRPDVYCTLLVSDDYLPGAMVLGHSLRDNGTQKQLAVLVTLDTVSAATIEQLRTVYDQVIPVDRMSNRFPANLYLMDRLDLHSAFTKIALWRQTQFRRIVYIDADVVALRAPDELFDRKSAFAAAPDVGWPDCFNSGVMALTPNMGDYYALLAMAQRGISFDGADQGLLNMHFRQYDRLSFTYNCTPSGHYQYVPAYKHFQSSISLIHFIGKQKPWHSGREIGGSTGIYDELLGRWWAVYDRHFRGVTYTYAPEQGHVPNRTVQQHVVGEPVVPQAPPPEQVFSEGTHAPQAAAAARVFHPPGYQNPEPQHAPAPASMGSPMLERPDPVESIDREVIAPAPTVEQRRFSAPLSEWDPITQPPPPQSRPEAVNFPQQTYTMSDDRALFQPPKSYPEPPKDMWYEVPKTPPAAEKPRRIFPWEATQAKPTRVFAKEESPPEEKPLDKRPPPIDTAAASAEVPIKQNQTTPTIQVTPVEAFSSYSRTNAWDEDPEIERYMSRFQFGRRARVQVLHQSDNAASPSTENGPGPKGRRQSLKVTDFPTEVERPSLPVTPAPVRRDLYWGEERDGASELPPAEGVPKQTDWDPLKKLEELQRRQSEVLAQGPRRPSIEVPQRSLPESAVLLPTSEETEVPQTSSVSDSSRPLSEATRSAAAAVEAIQAPNGEDAGVFSATGE